MTFVEAGLCDDSTLGANTFVLARRDVPPRALASDSHVLGRGRRRRGPKQVHSHLDRRFPDQMLKLRRLMRDDPAFRELCGDYEAAAAALDYWRSPERRSHERVEDYQRLVEELEAEIEAALSRQIRGS